MITDEVKAKAAGQGFEDQAKIQPATALGEVSPELAQTDAGVRMRIAEAIARRVHGPAKLTSLEL